MFDVIQAVCPPVDLTTRTVVGVSPEHADAVEHAGDGRFDGFPGIERVAQLGRRTTHVSMRIRAELPGEMLDPSEGDFDLIEL